VNVRAALWPPASARRPQQQCKALLPPHAARLLTFTGLAIFGALHWSRLVQPAASGALLAVVAASLAGSVVLLAVARRRPAARVRIAATLLVGATLLVVAFAAAGVSGRYFLDPYAWSALAAGIGQGLSAVPSVSVPYAGLDEWTRSVMVLGGGALIGTGALLAFAVRRDGAVGYPSAAAIALITLYAVAIIQRDSERPFLAGAAFALALALFLCLERVERRSAKLAAGAVAAALLVALVAAPRIDAAGALLNYEEIAQSLTRSATTQYDWNHRYGPLTWPRDGREVLRVRASARSYWKAVDLVAFDGIRWAQTAERPQSGTAMTPRVRGWRETIRVTVRALRSSQFVAAGTTLGIPDSPRPSTRSAPGRFETSGQPLSRGQAYRARVYVPRPTAAQMRGAGSAYPDGLIADYGSVGVQPLSRAGGAQSSITLAFWGRPSAGSSATQPDAGMRGSPSARVYALVRRLRAQAANPYEYMRAIERYLRRGFAYTERPRPSAVPLEAFLFDDRAGYCQQFSGAMALLLRLGGVPARVAAGFSPGVFDAKRGEYVVRDSDAHSWVEVYFPQIGWVTRDPTPAVSPARSQTADLTFAGPDGGVAIGGAGERAGGASAERGSAGETGGGGAEQGSALPAEAIAALGLLLALAIVLAIRVGRNRPARTNDEDVAELRRALQRSGHAAQPQLTLEALAQRFAGTVAENYVRLLAAARYGYGVERPSRAQRAGLRRELAAGLGLRGQLRAWRALPPRTRRR
jgi:transglutaminase-like putative cysteine protease